MSKRTMVSSAVLFFSFGLICVANGLTSGSRPLTAEFQAIAGAPRQAIDCNDRKAVAKAIYLRYLREGFTKKEIRRINVSFNVADGVVTLRGFVAPKNSRPSQEMVGVKKAGVLADAATTCEKRVENLLTSALKHGCQAGETRCGDTGQCIRPPEECNAGLMR